LNAGFDGSPQTALITSGTLGHLDTAQIQIQVTLTTLIDGGSGLGIYATNVTATAESPDATPTSDASDFGTDPDPNGNGFPNEILENDNTAFTVAQDPVVGLGLTTSVLGGTVSFDYYLEAFGNTDLATLDVTQDLDALFGAGNYFIAVAPTLLDNPGTITLNSAFDGSTQQSLITSGSLAQFDTAQIHVEVTLTQLIDGGSGLGNYSVSGSASAASIDGTPTTDTSDEGTDPDPNGNGDPTQAGENDPSTFTVAQDPVIGVALSSAVLDDVVTLTYSLEAFGNVDLSNLQLPHNLDAVFGSGNFTVTGAPAFTDDPGTITLNNGFDGSGTDALITSGTLALGDTAQFTVEVTINAIINPGGGLGVYTTSVTASAQSADTTPTTDVSDEGSDPDPNGNADPTEAGENDDTTINVAENPVIGIAQSFQIVGNQVLLIYTLENLGNVTLTNIVLQKDLSLLFGTGFFVLSTPPNFSTDPGTLTLNAGYDGETDIDIIDSGTLTVGTTAVIELGISLSFVINDGNFNDQTTILADGEGGTNTSDDSVDGTDPDPDGDGNPGGANEDDGSDFQVPNSSIGDTVFNDLNGNGLRDSGEPGISGVILFDDANMNLVRDPGEFFGQTDGNGNYGIDGLIAGSYNVRVDLSSLPPDAVFTAGTNPLPVTLAESEDFANADYGFQVQNSSVGGFVWNDLNGDGVQDMGEPGLADIAMFLDFNNNGIFEAEDIFVDTEADGTYSFSSLSEGTYNVTYLPASLPPGFVQTGGTNPFTVTIVVDEMFTEADFGFQQQTSSIGDFVWDDQNRDGVQDMGEPGLAGVTVYLDLNSNGALDGGEPSAVTDAAGLYDITNLAPDTYQVTVDPTTLPADYILSTGSINPQTVMLGTDEDFNDADFGFREQGAGLGGLVFNDLDGNGVQDAGDIGVGSITLFLDDNTNGVLDGGEDATTTDASGNFLFSDLPADSYTLTVDVTSFAGNFVNTTSNNPLPVTLAPDESNLTNSFGFQQRDGSIAGQVWDDVDGSNTFNTGDSGLAGITVFLDENSNGIADMGEDSTVTDGNGDYSFLSLEAGTYAVTLDVASLPATFNVTFPSNPISVTIAADGVETGIGFALQQGDGQIGGTFFVDANRNQVQDVGEGSLANVTLTLVRNGNVRGLNQVGTTTTDTNGDFLFENLIQGNYSIQVTDLNSVLADFELTVSPGVTEVALQVGQATTDLGFGYCQIPTVAALTEDQRLCNGDPLELSVEAAGSGTLSYQWRKDGQDIPGETDPTFSITFTAEEDSGIYTCLITNDCGETETVAIDVEVVSL
ncbi:MAG: SdrD B-like domain-containing protein, partial [Kangiellaceae bacterium]|nr:SdrD B-like domain-containing protein [Kangiellaceae bacterium]